MSSAGYFRHPTVFGDRLIFSCEDALWTVPTSGGTPRRLTTGRGSATFPLLSPDGSLVAYSATDDGPDEVHVMPADGGPSRRLTFTGGPARAAVWRPDGRSVVIRTSAGEAFQREEHLHDVSPDGGPTRRLPLGPTTELAFEPEGKGMAIARHSGDPARWKRYRGGTAGSLWVDRSGDGRFERLIDLEGNLAAPCWIGRRIYFLSDHEGHGNLYSCTPTGRDLTRHTHHELLYVRHPTTDGRSIAYSRGGDLHVLDVTTGEDRRVEIDWRSQRPERARRYVDAEDFVESAQLHPRGEAIALVARGGVFTFDLWEGAPLRQGPGSESRLRLARWLPDGERVVAVTDERGEESLVVLPRSGGPAKHLAIDVGRPLEMESAPAGRDRVAIANHRQELWIVDLVTGKATQVTKSPHDRLQGMAWSPDGRWLAFGWPASLRAAQIRIHDTKSETTHDVTLPDFGDFAPAWDPAGRYLYFLSRRVFDPVYDNQYFDLGFPRGVRPYLVTLRADLPDPFSSAQRPPKRPRTDPKPPDPDDRKTPLDVEIDFDGITDRVVAFPVDEGRYERILGAHGRALFTSLPIEGSLGQSWHESGEPAAKAMLESHDFETDRTETVVDHLTDFSLSADARTLLLRVGNSLRVLPAEAEAKDIPDRDEPSRDTGWIDLDRVRLLVEPAAEWRQMLREAWRLQRDHFWTEDMSKIDWERVLAEYLPLVERVATRSEFSDLIWEMQGELGTSHCYELGGDYSPEPEWHQGFLGADFALDRRSRQWRIERIPKGDSWEPKACSPLVAPGLGIAEGDALLAIDGRDLSPTVTPGECLVNQACTEVVLTIAPQGRAKNARRVTVTTLASETSLRYRDWVERNRSIVHERTKGRVGYVHVPDMGAWGYSEFHRYYRNEVLKDGLIVDVRWNRGGHVSQLLLEKLNRKRISYDQSRWMTMDAYPADAPAGPMVALTNQNAGSDGDIFSHAFKLYGLGPLIGTRTWGGVIGIWPRHALVDGTVTTQAEFSSWFTDVGWGIENRGAEPDIEVDVLPQDHAKGVDTQLERGLSEIGKLLKSAPKPPKLTQRPNLRPPRLPRGASPGKKLAKKKSKR